MGAEMAQRDGSAIDKNSAAAITALENADLEGKHVITISSTCTAYSISSFDARTKLARNLQAIIDPVFEAIPDKDTATYLQKDYLMEAAGLLAKESPDILVARHESIQTKLDSFFDVINKVYDYAVGDPSFFGDFKTNKEVKKYVRNLNDLTNRKLGLSEIPLVLAREHEDPRFITIDTSKCSEALHNFLRHSSRKSEPETAQSVAEENFKREEWLSRLSPDLLNAYKETEERRAEVTPLATSAEDEYFLEQIPAEYYASIFESLENLNNADEDFSYKEAVVVESIKQFKIIQLGLQRIMDGVIAHNLNSIRSQTDFLRNKVLGEKTLSLSPNEQEEVIDTSLEESQRIREELYKKHVAPVLEKNRQEYEDRLTQERLALETAHQTAWDKREQEYTTAREKRERENKAAWQEREEAHAARVAELEGKLTKARVEWKRLNSVNKELKKDYEEQIYQLDCEITTLETRILYNNSTHKTAITNYYNHVQHLQSEISQLQSVVMDYIDKYESDKSLPQVKEEVAEKTKTESALPSQWHKAAETEDEAGELRNLAKVQRDAIAAVQKAKPALSETLEEDQFEGFLEEGEVIPDEDFEEDLEEGEVISDEEDETPALITPQEWNEVLKGEFHAQMEFYKKHNDLLKVEKLLAHREQLLKEEIEGLQRSIDEAAF